MATGSYVLYWIFLMLYPVPSVAQIDLSLAFVDPHQYSKTFLKIWYCSRESSSGNTIYLPEFIQSNMVPGIKSQLEMNAFVWSNL